MVLIAFTNNRWLGWTNAIAYYWKKTTTRAMYRIVFGEPKLFIQTKCQIGTHRHGLVFEIY